MKQLLEHTEKNNFHLIKCANFLKEKKITDKVSLDDMEVNNPIFGYNSPKELFKT